MILTLREASASSGGLIESQPAHRLCFTGAGWGLRICFSIKPTGGAGAVGPETRL